MPAIGRTWPGAIATSEQTTLVCERAPKGQIRTLDQPARNLGDVGRDPPRLVFGE